MENIFSTKNIKDIYALSPMQEGMLFNSLRDESSSMYFEQTYYTLKGEIIPQLFENQRSAFKKRRQNNQGFNKEAEVIDSLRIPWAKWKSYSHFRNKSR